MPTDSIIDNLSVFDAETGEKYKLGHIKDIELTATETIDEQVIKNYIESNVLSVEIKQHRATIYYLYRLTGRKDLIPNNWLKRHKIPMNRRK